MRITHILKCLEILTMTKAWLHAYDFNQYGHVFIGHRGCARISDTQKKYPYLVEVRNDPQKPRLYEYRLKWEGLDEALAKLKEDDLGAYSFLKGLLRQKGIVWREYRMVPRETGPNTVVMEPKLIEIR